MEGLQRGFRLRVLLCMVDTEDNTKTLIDVHKVAVVNGWTLILAWSPEEAVRYLETYQVFLSPKLNPKPRQRGIPKRLALRTLYAPRHSPSRIITPLAGDSGLNLYTRTLPYHCAYD